MPGNPISCKLFIFALISFNAVFIAVVSGLLIFTGVGSFTTSAGPGSAKANNKCVCTSPESPSVEFAFDADCAVEPADPVTLAVGVIVGVILAVGVIVTVGVIETVGDKLLVGVIEGVTLAVGVID